MNTRARLIAMLVLLILVAALIAILRFTDLGGGDDADLTPTPEQAGALFPETALEVVTSFTVTDNEGGATFSARLAALDATPTPEGTPEADAEEPTEPFWVIVEPPLDPQEGVPDDTRLNSAAANLPGLTPLRSLSEVEALATYGLESPHYTLQFTTSGGGDYTLLVGDQSAVGSGYYVQVPGDPLVYIISTYSLDPLILLLEAPPVITPQPEVTPTPEG
ncbi:MAG: hypothetical protein Kow00124_10540 [Anaerolineae bacterium]